MKLLVTGGGGFLGSAIVKQLRTAGHDVISYTRNHYPELGDTGALQMQGDIADYSRLSKAAAGCDGIFHVAARTGTSGHYRDFYQTNVWGTEQVLRACRQYGIKNLVFTSSPSVVFDGKDLEGGDESLPYPKKYSAWYPKTKALAEQLVMAANSASLRTVSLRPHLIWGPGDTHYLPALIKRSQGGSLCILGNAPKLVDCTYIDNAAMAHIRAFDRLLKHPEQLAGKTYFISQESPIPVTSLMNMLLASGGCAPVTRHLPAGLVRFSAKTLERLYRALKLNGEPPVSYFVAQQLSTAHWFDITAAKRDFGYSPDISIEQGMERLRMWVASGQYARFSS
ncbi:NAD-dependent epimerase/dehydratase family protein [Flavihumibacter petaseus]|uniref:Putative oxidoreductase n=1 Tax=Flavihumibacter petaseus NBRC 106054 TaxID=1220578 RepID=A0A0E9MUN7_9BACT|nr:NAD-dependent epimerase/dehydratase family protein [Flavihumibacter petaseus]GAO41452.1 putative oxidoreductase [Flavihumibacter petaseus NBRC 106054]